MTTFTNTIPQGYPDSSLAGSFNTWISDLFRDKATFDRKDIPRFKFSSLTAYYERHLYFVTMHFQPGLGAVRDSRSPARNGYLFDSIYKGWYLSVCEKLLGPKFHKKPILQPFSMAFGPGEGWHEERVLYLEQDHGDAITAIHHRVNSDSMVFDILENLLETAIPYVKAKEVDRANEVDAELTKAPELFKVIDLTPFNVDEFYRDVPGGIENFWGPMGFVAERTVKKTPRN